MDEFIVQSIKFLSNTITVRVASHPPFAIEIFLSAVVCIVHLLLIFEINALVKRTNARAVEKLKIKHASRESCSYDSLVPLQPTLFQKKTESIDQKQILYMPFNSKRLQRKISGASNFGWIISQGDSMLRNKFDDRVDNLLAISPSEYVRRDKERKSREAGLRSCLQSLTSLLEKAINNDTLDLQNVSKDDMKRSINAIRENFESQISNSYQLSEFPSPSLQSLIAQSAAKNALENSLSPNLMPSIYRTSNARYSYSNFDCSNRKNENVDEKSRGDAASQLVFQKSNSLSEIFRKSSDEFHDGNEKYSKIVLAN
ncbi:uncharacterized protein LOC132706344 [Cylas formicarius]|uniref:uncharacterized protein LOC132706344 n=1 Tax=Cylas formicarius TaxID=197179 RepID=UPI002958C348|nr:uncharacterized protein LOC132706344 [Cylas formicarius]